MKWVRRPPLFFAFAVAGALLVHISTASATVSVASSLSSFQGIENPKVIYNPTTGTFSANPYANIVDEGDLFGDGEVFRFTLRYYPNPQTDWPGYPSTFWDGNLSTTTGSSATDRQRAEVRRPGAVSAAQYDLPILFQF